MGIRETLNKNPAIATGATVGVILLALIVIVWQITRSPGEQVTVAKKLFFSDDDGKTIFEDNTWSIPPFMHNGKEAVRAHVYRCGAGGKPIIGWLEKYDKTTKDRMDKFFSDPKHQGKYSLELFDDAVRVVKKPGEPAWRKGTYQALDALRNRKCPDGQVADEIYPPLN